ncbi:MAG TPA: hypothetical protein ENG35_07615 [Desulfobacteraceae bacterium]|nr:hypothetical protein [Desulfobacteraceae bacterium]
MKPKPNHLMLVISIFSGVTCFAQAYSGYDNYIYDPNDFATGWIEYYHNGMYNDWLSGMPFDDPTTTLGRPTIDTTGDDWYIPEDEAAPVNPVYPAFRYFEMVFLGEEGYITVEFNHPVRDDENNPYGIDFIVFGNAFQVIGGGQGWTNGDPALTTVGPDGFYEPGIVSVSQDGITWYSFTNDSNFMSGDPNFVKLPADVNDGPFCDSFAPTLGRVYDPCNPDTSIGEWNQWWAEPTNPTFPVDPNLWFDSFDGYTVAQICETYGNSAGGTGYDIDRLDLPVDPVTGKKWFQYVRIDDKTGGGNAELDAVSDVSCCGDYKHPFPQGDISKDCRVNFEDYAILAGYWLEQIVGDDPAKVADIYEDDNDIIDLYDLGMLADNWLSCSWDCD